MNITPDTYVKLVRFDVTKEHQLTFADLSTQQSFFDNLSGIELSNFTYQRKENVVRWSGLIDDIEQYNYLIYQNSAYSNKFYYCYITNMEYINDGRTDIQIKLDVFQTFQFDFIYKQCFVEREHVNDDTIGKHTINEGLETGEYVLNHQLKYTDIASSFLYIVLSPVWSGHSPQVKQSTDLGGISFSGLVYATDSITTLNQIIDGLNGKQTEPSNVYVVPKAITTWTAPSNPQSWEDYEWNGQVAPKLLQYTFTKPTTIDGYLPTNNKLLCYPYNYLIVNNNNGNSTKLKFEHFSSSDCEFDIYGMPVCRWFNSSCTTSL